MTEKKPSDLLGPVTEEEAQDAYGVDSVFVDDPALQPAVRAAVNKVLASRRSRAGEGVVERDIKPLKIPGLTPKVKAILADTIQRAKRSADPALAGLAGVVDVMFDVLPTSEGASMHSRTMTCVDRVARIREQTAKALADARVIDDEVAVLQGEIESALEFVEDSLDSMDVLAARASTSPLLTSADVKRRMDTFLDVLENLTRRRVTPDTNVPHDTAALRALAALGRFVIQSDDGQRVIGHWPGEKPRKL